MTENPRSIRLSEVVGALSYALDLTEGEPPGHALRSCLIGMRLAQEIGLDAAARSDLFYALLLKDAGCSANSARMAALFGADDHDRQAHVQARRLGREAAGPDVVAADGRPRRLAARPRPAAARRSRTRAR